MPKIHLALGSYRSNQSDRVPEGRYTVRVQDVDVQKSNQGNTMIVTWLEVVSGDFKGSVLVDRLTITEKAMFRIVGFMKALKMPTSKDVDIDPRVFLNRLLDVDVVDREYRETISSNVSGYMPATGSADSAQDTADLDDVEATEPELDTEAKAEPAKDAATDAVATDAVDAPLAEDAGPEVVDLDSIEIG